MNENPDFQLACPTPIGIYEHVVMAHGGGGRLMQQLLDKLVQPAFANPYLAARHDSAVFEQGGQRYAFTTDSYVVKPMFFPGGDIGKLAVCGTLNDLAMAGAKPLFLSAGLIIEEGLPLADLQRILNSMAETARAAGALIVTGDTKVVDRGKGDGLYINTAGIGLIEHGGTIAPASVRPGDAVLINGDIGRHGIAIMAQREGLAFETTIESDCADLSGLVGALLEAGIEIHCLRDLTRGGLASALIEIAQAAGVNIEVREADIPVREDVQGACEILGFDPLYVANEGRLAAFVPADQAERALAALRQHPLGADAAIIGQVPGSSSGAVNLQTAFGINRPLDLLSGEQLPRIC
ncbi:hydrogenase expression/formation protein HypE [Methylococcus sp. EFPC2]|uniref:hydrogenase expression/formation protein HypE n=1 Tax=Methylococcus sp. EFPC2 TaxID=2812648 RepID=UPI001967C8C1|nr:hydrogenase expression/formation protein HypE [Methylococcus sp. EFPC2]QSA97317.1 hydrogenase expression/formation protein HypE [Methylococcus sp. EFPC2]